MRCTADQGKVRERLGKVAEERTGAVPLNEESERYALEVLDEDGDLALTVEDITSPSHVLSETELQAAMADGLAVPLGNPSFETGDLSGWTVESGSFSVTTSIAAGITPADGSYFAYQSGLGSGAISQVVDVSDYHLESGDIVTLQALAADWTSSSDTADLTIEAFDAGGAPVGTATTSTDLAVEDAWEQVSVELTLTGTPATIKITLAATNVSGGSQASIASDAAELRLDGASVATFSGDTRNGGNPDIAKVQFRAQGSGNHDLYVDDVYVCDTSGAQNNDFLGDVRIETLRPNADTAQADWTPSTGTDHYAVVDDAPGYDGTDYVESDTVGHVDLWDYGDLGSTPQAIHAVQLVTAMQKTDAGTREARAVLRSGATTANGATRQLSTSWQQFEDLHETDPDTGAAWTEGGVNALQAGAEVVT